MRARTRKVPRLAPSTKRHVFFFCSSQPTTSSASTNIQTLARHTAITILSLSDTLFAMDQQPNTATAARKATCTAFARGECRSGPNCYKEHHYNLDPARRNDKEAGFENYDVPNDPGESCTRCLQQDRKVSSHSPSTFVVGTLRSQDAVTIRSAEMPALRAWVICTTAAFLVALKIS